MDDTEIEIPKKRIMTFFEQQSDEDYWKTLDEISRATKVEQSIVLKVISRSGDFVRSSYRSKAGEPVYTTRTSFRRKAPIVDKIIGAFKNRID